MKRLKLVFALSVALSVLSGLAFVNNLAAIVNWWRAFRAAAGDTTLLSAHAPGLFGWLDWSAVDYSGVTTFIPFLGMLCLTRAVGRLLRGRPVPSADFPFFRGSDQFNIALGLFGTLWGIIVIGYYRLETVQMADLMQCLHTALFSTLMAVVWVFLLDRPLIRPFFLRLLTASGLAETEAGDLAGAVECLTSRLLAASAAFDARQKQFEETAARRLAEIDEAFSVRQAEAEKRLARQQAEIAQQLARQQAEIAQQLARQQAEFGRLNASAVEQCERHLADYERLFEARQKEYVETFRREIEMLKARAEDAQNRLAAVAAALRT